MTFYVDRYATKITLDEDFLSQEKYFTMQIREILGTDLGSRKTITQEELTLVPDPDLLIYKTLLDMSVELRSRAILTFGETEKQAIHKSIQAALDVFNKNYFASSIESIAKTLPGVMEIGIPCPVNHCTCASKGLNQKLYYLIQHLNDTHMWSRSDIADWLDSLDADLSFK